MKKINLQSSFESDLTSDVVLLQTLEQLAVVDARPSVVPQSYFRIFDFGNLKVQLP